MYLSTSIFSITSGRMIIQVLINFIIIFALHYGTHISSQFLLEKLPKLCRPCMYSRVPRDDRGL